MKSVYLNAPYEIEIKDVPEPDCREGEVRVKIESVGVCGSDISAYKGESPLCTYPRIIGHELFGTVVEAKTDQSVIKVGDKVVLEPYFYCGECYPCSIGRTNCCEALKVLGVHIDGGMSEYFCYPAQFAYKVLSDFPKEELAFVEPLSIAIHCANRLEVKKGEHVVIMGAGQIGNLAAQVTKVMGAIPIMADLLDSRLELAKSIGVEYTFNPSREDLVEKVREITGGRMAECVIEATGAISSIQSTLEVVAYSGRISLVGWPKNGTPFPTGVITKKELDVRGSRNSAREFPLAIELITKKKVNVKPLISKVVSLEEAPKNIRLQAEHPSDYLKIIGVF